MRSVNGDGSWAKQKRGREDFLNKGGTIAEMDKIANTMNWAKT